MMWWWCCVAQRPKSICRVVSCGKAIDAPGYCEQHKRESVGWNKSHQGKTTTERGLGWKWQKIRLRILKRDGELCQPCQRQGRIVEGREVDHIIPRAIGGTNDDANLQTICKACHLDKTQREKR